MKRAKLITSNAELEEFLARTDIEIINVDMKSFEQSWLQEYFTAVIYYDDGSKSEYFPDYWTHLEHQYAGMAMQGILSNPELFMATAKNAEELGLIVPQVVAIDANWFAHALVEKFRNAENPKDLEGLKMKLEALKIEKTILENKVKLLKEERK